MKTYSFLSSALLASVFLVACNVDNGTQEPFVDPTPPQSEQETTEQIQPPTTETENEEVNPMIESNEIDEDWVEYINNNLGFKINHPKTHDDGELVEMIESGEVVYIETQSYASEIEEKKDLLPFKKVQGIPFAILIQEVNNDEELEEFI